MVKPGRHSFSDTRPHFFKVYLPERSSQQLRIPPAFIRKSNGVLPSKCTIMNHGRRSWSVELKKVDDNLYFQDGWHQFVKDNSLELGEFLVFCYGGNSMFSVNIFGKSGCLKKVPIPTRKYEQPTLEDTGKQITKRTLRSHSRGVMATEENDGASKATTEWNFQVVLKPSYAQINGSYLNIPFSFIKKHMEKGKESAILQVLAKSWPVKVKTYVNRLARFSLGWPAFVKDNALKAGDVCVFELIERNNFVLKVSIMRNS